HVFFPIPVHCSPPKAVANAHIDAGNRTELNSRLRYSCKPGYKRKAGTSSLIQCVLWNGSQPRWTEPTLQCIRTSWGEAGTPPPNRRMGRNASATRVLFPPKESEMGRLDNFDSLTYQTTWRVRVPADGVSLLCFPQGDPALSREAPGAASTTQRAGTTSASPNSSPSPAPSQSPVPPAPDGPSPDGSRPPEMVPTPDTPTLGEGTTALPMPPSDYAAGWADSQGMPTSPGAWGTHKGSLAFPMELFLLSDLLFSEAPPSIHPSPTFAAQHFLFSPFPVSIRSVASSVGLLALLAIGIAAVCCWRRRRRRRRRRKGARQGYAVTETDIPMEGIPSGNEEVPPPVIVPTG
ncbi:LOW QUALITY PROTEIN: interleukin-15 receptor subunit alpha, partial [Melospiza melodia melodia]|uniref:LOW QUALITY PROTEIN: interleukin-15 receptor subunit alpha n=1 Tax=Melospiza melodia melodia TaxID=1914991 RepID=UPI002FD32344